MGVGVGVGQSATRLKGIAHLIFNAYEGKIDAGKMMQTLIAKARNLGVEIFFGAEVLAYQTQNNAGTIQKIVCKK